MTNNDFLRSFRYALELDPRALCTFFSEGGASVSLRDAAAMLKNDDEQGFESLSDELLGQFLDGLITTHRGQRESRASLKISPARRAMTNNRLLRALRIAFELRDTDIQAFMQAAGREVSKAELGALFRREDHRNYLECGDQFMRAFLRGLGLAHRQRPTP